MTLETISRWRKWRSTLTERDAALRICSDVAQAAEDDVPALSAHAGALFTGDQGLAKAIREICSEPSQLGALPASASTEALLAAVTALDVQLANARRCSPDLGLLLELEQERRWISELVAKRDELLRQIVTDAAP
jgi:hypothetical protein